jgi:hypothetical protein
MGGRATPHNARRIRFVPEGPGPSGFFLVVRVWSTRRPFCFANVSARLQEYLRDDGSYECSLDQDRWL